MIVDAGGGMSAYQQRSRSMARLAAILPSAALLLASFTGVAADLQVTSPSSSLWWGAYNFFPTPE